MRDELVLPRDGRGTVVTVGTFDGVHLGHRRVLQEIATRAQRADRRSLLVTFDPHPLEVVNPAAAPHLITVAEERTEYLAQCELDIVVFMAFTHALSQYPPVSSSLVPITASAAVGLGTCICCSDSARRWGSP
jgi:riboflavin kinase/FMN adenylyltransferase